MSAAASEVRLNRRSALSRSVAWVIVLMSGAFLAIGAVFDLATDAAGRLPSDHEITFRAVTGIGWAQAAAVVHPVTPYVTRAEAGYAAYELLLGLLLLIVAAIPLRRGERWAWWSCWLLVCAFGAFAVLFGAHDSGDLGAAIIVGLLVVLALGASAPAEQAAG